MTTNTITEFYVTPNKPVDLYIIESDTGQYLAMITRTIRFVPTNFQMVVKIEYELQYNVCKQFTQQERGMIRMFYDNIVSLLTNDIHTLYGDDLDERLDLPFMKNILHVKAAK